MAKTNTGLVEYCKAQLGRPYWFGTFGNIATEQLWNAKARQYSKYYTKARKATMQSRGDLGQKVHDCAGLVKGYIMSADPNSPAEYDAKYDISADDLFKRATEKGTIDTLPEIAGIGLYKSGHAGVYIGGGKEIEARGFDYGVLEDDVKNTGFTHWYKIPNIEYGATEAPVEAPEVAKKSAGEIAGEVIAGKWGNGAERVQRLTEAGYDASYIQDIVNETLAQKEHAKAATTFEGKIITQKDNLRVRTGAGTNYSVVKYLKRGETYEFDGESNGWYHLADNSGYASASYIQRV